MNSPWIKFAWKSTKIFANPLVSHVVCKACGTKLRSILFWTQAVNLTSNTDERTQALRWRQLFFHVVGTYSDSE